MKAFESHQFQDKYVSESPVAVVQKEWRHLCECGESGKIGVTDYFYIGNQFTTFPDIKT